MGLFVAGAVILSSTTSLHAKEPGAAFLSVDSSIRKLALGGVTTGAQGAQALGSNPALIAPTKDRSELYTSFQQLWGDTTNGHLAFASAINRKQSWGLSATFLDAGKTSGRDESGNPTNTQTATHHEIGAGAFSLEVKQGLHAGIAGNIFQSTLAGETTGVAWAVDTGVSFNVKKFLLSASANHLGPGIKYVEQKDVLPSVLQMDASWEPGPLTVLMGYHRSLAGAGAQGAFGFEYRWRALALRAGIHTEESTTNELLDNLTTGFGLHLGKALRMDYAYQQNAPDWGPAHAIALTWFWGEVPRPPSPKKHPPAKKNKVPEKLRIKG